MHIRTCKCDLVGKHVSGLHEAADLSLPPAKLIGDAKAKSKVMGRRTRLRADLYAIYMIRKDHMIKGCPSLKQMKDEYSVAVPKDDSDVLVISQLSTY